MDLQLRKRQVAQGAVVADDEGHGRRAQARELDARQTRIVLRKATRKARVSDKSN